MFSSFLLLTFLAYFFTIICFLPSKDGSLTCALIIDFFLSCFFHLPAMAQISTLSLLQSTPKGRHPGTKGSSQLEEETLKESRLCQENKMKKIQTALGPFVNSTARPFLCIV